MREILFRGQTRKKGERVFQNGKPVDGNWVYGGVFAPNADGDFAIIYGALGENSTKGINGTDLEKFVVHRDTIGQYSGLCDKHGTKIFEGDIVKASYSISDYDVSFKKHNIESFIDIVGEVFFDYGEFKFKPKNSNRCKCLFGLYNEEVIGNAHDNPELLD